jgi:Flp pilus assembly protein TadG
MRHPGPATSQPAPSRRCQGPHGALTGHPEQGAVSVLVVALLPAVLVLIALLVEVGSAVAVHRELLDTADAAARAGATAIDTAVYRSSDGHVARLDPVRARQVATDHLRRNGDTSAATIVTTTDQVRVHLIRDQPAIIFRFVGVTRLAADATAVPQTGITEPETP